MGLPAAKIIQLPSEHKSASIDVPMPGRRIPVRRFRGVVLENADAEMPRKSKQTSDRPQKGARLKKRVLKTDLQKELPSKKSKAVDDVEAQQFTQVLTTLAKEEPTFLGRFLFLLASLFLIMPSEEEQIEIIEQKCGLRPRKIKARVPTRVGGSPALENEPAHKEL